MKTLIAGTFVAAAIVLGAGTAAAADPTTETTLPEGIGINEAGHVVGVGEALPPVASTVPDTTLPEGIGIDEAGHVVGVGEALPPGPAPDTTLPEGIGIDEAGHVVGVGEALPPPATGASSTSSGPNTDGLHVASLSAVPTAGSVTAATGAAPSTTMSGGMLPETGTTSSVVIAAIAAMCTAAGFGLTRVARAR